MAVIAIVTLIFLFMIFALALVNCKTTFDIEDSDKEQIEFLKQYQTLRKKEGNNIDKTV